MDEIKNRKAKIKVLNGKHKGKEISVCFNPTEYTLDKSNEFANINIPGLESPFLQYTRGGLETLTVDLFFDTYETGKDVREEYVKKIEDLMKIDEKLHAPPICQFIWGKLSFTSVISKINKKFTMFNSDGIPVRATLSVTFNEYKTEAELKGTLTESPDRTKVYTLKEGDSLWAIAKEEYGDPSQWRAIAKVNDINNPRFIPIGEQIIIPPLKE